MFLCCSWLLVTSTAHITSVKHFLSESPSFCQENSNLLSVIGQVVALAWQLWEADFVIVNKVIIAKVLPLLVLAIFKVKNVELMSNQFPSLHVALAIVWVDLRWYKGTFKYFHLKMMFQLCGGFTNWLIILVLFYFFICKCIYIYISRVTGRDRQDISPEPSI